MKTVRFLGEPTGIQAFIMYFRGSPGKTSSGSQDSWGAAMGTELQPLMGWGTGFPCLHFLLNYLWFAVGHSFNFPLKVPTC